MVTSVKTRSGRTSADKRFILSGNISVTDCGSFSSSKDTEWMVIVQSVTSETIKTDRLVWSSFEFNVPSLNTVDNIMVSNLQLRSINTTSEASCLSRVCHRFPATKA